MTELSQFTNNTPKIDPESLSYQVMPKSGGSMTGQPKPLVPPAPPGGTPPAVPHNIPTEPHPNPLNNKWVYILITIVLLIALAGVAYYLLGTGADTGSKEEVTSKLPKAQLLKYFGKEVCDDSGTCGDDADPDNDGLSNHKEFIAGTDLMNSDSDSDGLADGDEVNIYKTDPMKKYTDSRPDAQQKDYNDGVSVKNGYDPQTPGFKFTETALAKIQAAIEQYKLHEPTISTLKGIAPPSGAGSSTSSSQSTVAMINCGSVAGQALVEDEDSLTVTQKSILNCMDTAIVQCTPAKLIVDNTSSNTGTNTVEVLGRTGSDCKISSLPDKPTEFNKAGKCDVPMSFIAQIEETAKATPAQSGGVLFTVGLAIAGGGEVESISTGEKIKFQCS